MGLACWRVAFGSRREPAGGRTAGAPTRSVAEEGVNEEDDRAGKAAARTEILRGSERRIWRGGKEPGLGWGRARLA